MHRWYNTLQWLTFHILFLFPIHSENEIETADDDNENAKDTDAEGNASP
jgi:hypothetical protein